MGEVRPSESHARIILGLADPNRARENSPVLVWGCGRRTGLVRLVLDQTWPELRWAAHVVTVVYRQRQVIRRHCARAEQIEFGDPKGRVTPRSAERAFLDAWHRADHAA